YSAVTRVFRFVVTNDHGHPLFAPAAIWTDSSSDLTADRKRYLLDALIHSRSNDIARAEQYLADMQTIRAGLATAGLASVQIHDNLAQGGHAWTQAKVTIDEDPYRLGPYDAEIIEHRWMGTFVIPRFTAEVAQQLAKDTADWESRVFWRDGYAEVRVENGGPGGERSSTCRWTTATT
ncbi:hypothetical protein, partial [Streptomyces sp. NPDC056817]|uniref:hypothetical protein n=1 Tax=Streptomyces sp. NPDC056817 TaxID=3345950 RepID=UPI00369AB2AB